MICMFGCSLTADQRWLMNDEIFDLRLVSENILHPTSTMATTEGGLQSTDSSLLLQQNNAEESFSLRKN